MPENKGENEEGKGQETAPGEIEEEGKNQANQSNQSSYENKEEGGKQNPDQDFPNQAAAEKSYRNLMKLRTQDREKIREQENKIKNLQSQGSEEDYDEGGDEGGHNKTDIDSAIERRLSIRERERNTKGFFVNNPDVRQDASLLAEMENVFEEQPELKQLTDPLTVARDVAEARLGRVKEAASQQEREREERRDKTNTAKRRSAGHQYGASKREYESTDRLDDTREMSAEERDRYVREHQYD